MGKLASVLLPLLTLGAVVGCQEILDAADAAHPPTIRNLWTIWRSVNSCALNAGGSPGSRLLVRFQYVDPDSTIAKGNLVTVDMIFQPSGGEVLNVESSVTILGDGHSGTAECGNCTRFGSSDTSVNMSVILKDGRFESNPLSASILRPQGANLEVDSGGSAGQYRK